MKQTPYYILSSLNITYWRKQQHGLLSIIFIDTITSYAIVVTIKAIIIIIIIIIYFHVRLQLLSLMYIIWWKLDAVLKKRKNGRTELYIILLYFHSSMQTKVSDETKYSIQERIDTILKKRKKGRTKFYILSLYLHSSIPTKVSDETKT